MQFVRSIALVTATLLTSTATAGLITFTHEGIASGTLDGKTFDETGYVITAISDTDDIVSMPPFATYVPHLSATITIDGVGSFDFITQTTTFAEHLGQFGNPAIGFGPMVSEEPVGVSWGPMNPVFGGWDLTTSIGPITSPGFHTVWHAFSIETTGGILVFDDTEFFGIDLTFEAVAQAPAIEVAPEHLSSTLHQGQTQTHTLTISNPGEEPLDWQVVDISDGARGIRRPAHAVIPDTLPVGLKRGSGASLARAAITANQRAGSALSHPWPMARGDEVIISHSESMAIQALHSVACSSDDGVTTRPNRFLRTFALNDFYVTSDFDVTAVTFGVENLDTTTSVTVNLYTLEGTFIYDNLTLIGSVSESLSPQSLSLVTVPITGTVPAGATLVVEIDVPDLNGVAQFFAGANDSGETAPSYVAAPTCDLSEPVSFANIGFPQVHLVMTVAGTGTVEPLDCTLPDWAGVATLGGTVPPDDSQLVDVIFDSSDLETGAFEASLCLGSNDPEKPLLVVPMILTVHEALGDDIFRDQFQAIR